jgi:hypothetical protein
MANSVTITGTVTDSSGLAAPFSVVVQLDAVSITSATVSPSSAPAGTTRTLTLTASSLQGLPLTFATPAGTGLTFTPVSGQPAGQAQWTFVY